MKRLFAVIFMVFGLAFGAGGAISISTEGSGTLAFDELPLAADWSTKYVIGGAVSITNRDALDAMVQTNAAALITNKLLTSTVPVANRLAQWVSDGGFVILRSNGDTAATMMIATWRNDSDWSGPLLRVGLDLGRLAPLPEEMGLRIYFSLSGRAGSWQFAGEFTNAGPINFVLNVGMWTNSAALYLLWVDDNGRSEPDTGYLIDNVFAVPVLSPLKIVRRTASQVELMWPLSSPESVLQGKVDLVTANWHSVTNADVPTGGLHHVLAPADMPGRYFRLRRTNDLIWPD